MVVGVAVVGVVVVVVVAGRSRSFAVDMASRRWSRCWGCRSSLAPKGEEDEWAAVMGVAVSGLYRYIHTYLL